MTLTRAGAGIVLTALALGCESPSGPVAVRIQTTAPSYQIGAAIGFTATNVGSRTVYLARCCEIAVAVDRWRGVRWGEGGWWGCVAICSMVAVELPPSGTVTGAAQAPDTGRYRLRLGIGMSRAAPPDWSAASNLFDVR